MSAVPVVRYLESSCTLVPPRRLTQMGFLKSAILLLCFIASLSSTVLSDLVLTKVDRRIQCDSQIVRIISSLKVENVGAESVNEVLLAFPDHQVKNLAFLMAKPAQGKVKSSALPVEPAYPANMPPSLSFYAVKLPEELAEGASLTLHVVAVFTNVMRPFPEKIVQSEIQLVVFQETAYFLSPYTVKFQSLTVKLPPSRIESYTRLESTKLHGSEITYGPYKDLPAFSYSPVVIHFENNNPFAVAQELVREIQVSHWGNVQITEHYQVVHRGAQSKGSFSRLDFRVRPDLWGASSFTSLTAIFPPRAHSITYRDDIGNISTSEVRSDLRKTELVIEPRYPIFGGWRTAFTIQYGLPLNDFLFESEGKRFLNISFGCPISELVVENLVVKVVLPEGSQDLSVSVPFSVKQSTETKISHLDIVGRPVLVLEKTNVVPEHNQYFQVYYKFSSISMLRQPMMLISGFFLFFVACIIYSRADMSISKYSASYIARQQWDEAQAAIQQIQSIISQCLKIHDKLEASLRDLSRTGDVQTCKAARKSADVLLKDLSKDTKPLLTLLQSFPSAAQILPKVEELVLKERELQERVMAKHQTVVDGYEKKSGAKDIENRVNSLQQRLTVLRQEVEDLLDFIDEI